jgi:hypothetical protein
MHASLKRQSPTALARGGARKWIGLDGLITDIITEKATDQQGTNERPVDEAPSGWQLTAPRSRPIAPRRTVTSDSEPASMHPGGVR